MDHETISRRKKIEAARKLVEKSKPYNSKRYLSQPSADHWNDENWNNEMSKETSIGGRFILRLLLSGFLFLAVLSVTQFYAMGEEKAKEYEIVIEKALKTQTGVEKIKEMIRSIG